MRQEIAVALFFSTALCGCGQKDPDETSASIDKSPAELTNSAVKSTAESQILDQKENNDEVATDRLTCDGPYQGASSFKLILGPFHRGIDDISPEGKYKVIGGKYDGAYGTVKVTDIGYNFVDGGLGMIEFGISMNARGEYWMTSKNDEYAGTCELNSGQGLAQG